MAAAATDPGRRRHSVDVTAMTASAMIQPRLQNSVCSLEPLGLVSSVNNSKAIVQQQHNRHQHPIAFLGHTRHHVLASGEAIDEGHSKVQGQGLLRRTYYHGVGLVARLSSSALSPVKSSTSIQFPPSTTGSHLLTVGIDPSAAGRRRSDSHISMMSPVASFATKTTTTTTTTSSSDSYITSRRNSSPRPVRRISIVVSPPVDESLRSTSYEEELELRLEHVRLKALDAERRLAAERLRRRQAVQRMAELEQQHVDIVTRLTVEAERKTERLRARCDQVRDDCRRRMADAEKRAVTNAEHLETRVREVEAELDEALLLNKRFSNCRIVDPDQQRDVAMQVDIETKYEGQGDLRQVRSPSPSVNDEHPLTETLNGDPVVDDTRASTPTAASGSSDEIANSPIADQVWYHLYETITALALHRVRYLEELVAAGTRRQRLPETQAQLRRLQVLRRRIVKCDGGSSVGLDGVDGSRPRRHGNKETRIASMLSADVDNGGKKSADGVSGNSQTVSSPRLMLRRTSSCPAPDIFIRAADDNGADGPSIDERRADDALRSKSADKLCETMANRTQLDADSVVPSLSSKPGGQLTDNHSSWSMMSMYEMCDSAFGSVRMSPSADEIKTDDDYRSDMGRENSELARVTSMSSTKVRPRAAVVDVTVPPTITPTSTSKNAKRHSSLHREIFRKLQTGVANRRRDRSSFATSGATLAAAGNDDCDDRSDLVGRRSLSRNSMQSASYSEVSGTTKSTQVRPTASVSGPLRAVHSPINVGRSDAVDDAQSPPPFDVSSSSSDTRLRSLLRRSLPLSPRRFGREPLITSFSFGCSSEIASAASEVPSPVGNNPVLKDDTGVAPNTTLTPSSTTGNGNGRPKSSSFGRLHERRNGLTTVGSVQFKAVSASASGSGQQVMRNRTPSQSRLDSLAKNIKTYLTSQ